MFRARTAPLVLIIAIAASLALPQAVLASIDFTGSSRVRTVGPFQKLPVTFKATCPADKVCGAWFGTYTAGNVMVAIGQGNEIDTNSGLAQPGPYDAGTQDNPNIGHDRVMRAKSPTTVRLDKNITAGRWSYIVSWMECTPPAGGGDPAFNDCTVVHGSMRKINVPTTIGLVGKPIRTNAAASGKIKGGLFASLDFGCNNARTKFRTTLLLEKQVKVGRRYVWRIAAKKANMKLVNKVNLVCSTYTHMAIPRSIGQKTKFRHRYIIASIGAKPAAKRRIATGKVYTRATLPGGQSGIIIGS